MKLNGVYPDRTATSVFKRVTIALDLDASYENPYDPSDVRVDAKVVCPSGKIMRVPGFYYEPQTRTTTADGERIEPSGPHQWLLRMTFTEPGEHRVWIYAKNRAGRARSEPIVINVFDADTPGMIRLHDSDHRYFVTDRGESFYPVGANVCWSGQQGSSAYDEWLPKYAESGCNFFRVWLAPFWATGAMNTQRSGFNRIDQANAWRLDHIIKMAERYNLRVMLCIDSFNILRTTEKEYGWWEASPYVRSNGGPIDEPMQYFTSRRSRKAYRDRLRYLVARYGHSPSIFAWEFWNEVDLVDDYRSRTVASWHKSMARHLRKIDPWRHLMGTSYSETAGDPRVDGLRQLDFVQSHHYSAKDIPDEFDQDRLSKEAAKRKPHFTIRKVFTSTTASIRASDRSRRGHRWPGGGTISSIRKTCIPFMPPSRAGSTGSISSVKGPAASGPKCSMPQV